MGMRFTMAVVCVNFNLILDHELELSCIIGKLKYFDVLILNQNSSGFSLRLPSNANFTRNPLRMPRSTCHKNVQYKCIEFWTF